MTQIYIKQNIHKHQTQNFRRISPFGITPVEKAHKARTRWYRGPLRLFINTRFKKSIKKEWTEAVKNSKILYKCITANTSVIWQHAAHTLSLIHIWRCRRDVLCRSYPVLCVHVNLTQSSACVEFTLSCDFVQSLRCPPCVWILAWPLCVCRSLYLDFWYCWMNGNAYFLSIFVFLRKCVCAS